MNPPTKGTIQWIAPHLSEGEVKAIYELVLSDVTGADEVISTPQDDGEYNRRIYTFNNSLRAEQRREAAKLFGMDNK